MYSLKSLKRLKKRGKSVSIQINKKLTIKIACSIWKKKSKSKYGEAHKDRLRFSDFKLNQIEINRNNFDDKIQGDQKLPGKTFKEK